MGIPEIVKQFRRREGSCTTASHPMTNINLSLHRVAVWSPLAAVPTNRVILYSSYTLMENLVGL